jgi:hypothetical protein
MIARCKLAVIAVLTLALVGLTGAATCPTSSWGALSQSVAPITFASDPIMAQNQDGHLEVFAIGRDGALWHSWQLNDFVTWSPWSSFGAPPNDKLQAGGQGLSTPVSALPVLAVAMGHADELQVFALGASGVWQIGQAVRNANWGSWALVPPTLAPIKPIAVWAIGNFDGRIELFIVNQSTQTNLLSHTWQLADFKSWNPGFADFTPPGEIVVFNLALARDKSNRIVVASTFKASAWVRRQTGANVGWQDWQSVGGPSSGGTDIGSAQLATNADGRLELLLTASGGLDHWHTWQSNANDWSGFWDNLGPPVASVRAMDSGFATGPRSCINLLAVINTAAESFQLAGVTQKQPSIDWLKWQVYPPVSSDPVLGHMAVGRRHDGMLELFIRDPSGNLLHAVQAH